MNDDLQTLDTEIRKCFAVVKNILQDEDLSPIERVRYMGQLAAYDNVLFFILGYEKGKK